MTRSEPETTDDSQLPLSSHLTVRDAVLRLLAGSNSVSDAGSRLLGVIGKYLGWDFGALWVHDPRTGLLKCADIWPEGESNAFGAATKARSFGPGSGLPGRVWASGEPLWLEDAAQDDNFPRATAALRKGLHAALVFPAGVGGRTSAVLEFFSASYRKPDPDTLETANVLGLQIGMFLERLRAEEQFARLEMMARLRSDIMAALIRAAQPSDVLRACTDAMVTHLGVSFARIWTFNADEKVLELEVSSGLYTHTNGPHGRIPLGAFKIGWIAESRQPHFTNSVADDPRVTDHEWARREGMQSFVGLPLVVENRLRGVLAMFSRGKIESLVLEELGPVADAIAQFLDRARAQSDLAKSEGLKAAMLGTALDAIVAMDHRGYVVEFNPAAEQLFGHARAAAIGRPLAELIVPTALRDRHRRGLARYIATGESNILGRRIEITAVGATGEEFPVELSIARIPGVDPPLFTGFIRRLARTADVQE